MELISVQLAIYNFSRQARLDSSSRTSSRISRGECTWNYVLGIELCRNRTCLGLTDVAKACQGSLILPFLKYSLRSETDWGGWMGLSGSCHFYLVPNIWYQLFPRVLDVPPFFWHVDVQFDVGQSANMCSVAIWHKKTSFNCYSWHSSSRAGGLALMHSLSVVPLPTLLRLPRNCASLCPTSVVSIYRLLSASTEKRGCALFSE